MLSGSGPRARGSPNCSRPVRFHQDDALAPGACARAQLQLRHPDGTSRTRLLRSCRRRCVGGRASQGDRPIQERDPTARLSGRWRRGMGTGERQRSVHQSNGTQTDPACSRTGCRRRPSRRMQVRQPVQRRSNLRSGRVSRPTAERGTRSSASPSSHWRGRTTAGSNDDAEQLTQRSLSRSERRRTETDPQAPH